MAAWVLQSNWSRNLPTQPALYCQCTAPLYCHCTAPLYSTTAIQHHYTAPLYSTTVQHHCTATVHHCTAPLYCHCTPLYCTTIQHHCTAPLYSITIQHHYTASLCSITIQHQHCMLQGRVCGDLSGPSCTNRCCASLNLPNHHLQHHCNHHSLLRSKSIRARATHSSDPNPSKVCETTIRVPPGFSTSSGVAIACNSLSC